MVKDYFMAGRNLVQRILQTMNTKYVGNFSIFKDKKYSVPQISYYMPVFLQKETILI